MKFVLGYKQLLEILLKCTQDTLVYQYTRALTHLLYPPSNRRAHTYEKQLVNHLTAKANRKSIMKWNRNMLNSLNINRILFVTKFTVQ